jgi:hypothetical protein
VKRVVGVAPVLLLAIALLVSVLVGLNLSRPHGTRLADAVGGGLNLDSRVFSEKPIKRDSSSQCPPLDSDDKGIWVYVAENETDCFYELAVEWHPSPYGVFR